VVNYDVPHDTESYVHRIGRTGRAGREGDAILFVAPREKRMLHSIEKATRQKITMMELPSTEIINDKRIDKFKQRITDALAGEKNALFAQMIEQYQQEHNVPAEEIAAALAQLLQGDNEFLLSNKPQRKQKTDWDSSDDKPRRERSSRRDSGRDGGRERGRDRDKGRSNSNDRSPRRDAPPEQGMQRYRIEVGHDHDVRPGNIVGAIANEADISSKNIGRINIADDHSTVDLPADIGNEALAVLKKAWVSGQQLNISAVSGDGQSSGSSDNRGNDKPEKRRVDNQKSEGSRTESKFSDPRVAHKRTDNLSRGKGKGRGKDEPQAKLGLKKRKHRA